MKDTNQTKPRQSLKPLAALKTYILRSPGLIILAVTALFVSAGAMLTLPVAVRRMIDLGFSAENAAFIDRYFAMLIVVGLILALASATRAFCVNLIGERVVADMRADVFTHLTRLSPEFYEQAHSGEVMSRLTADTTQIKTAAGTSASQALRNLVMLIGAVIMMILTSTQLSLMVLIAIPLIVLPLVAYGKIVRQRSRFAQDTLADASAYASENLSALKTMQAYTHERVAITSFSSAVERAYQAARSRLVARGYLTALVIFFVFASIVGVLWYGATEVISGAMTAGTLSQFVLYSLFAAGAVGELSEVWGEIQLAAGATERLTELLEVKPTITSPENPLKLPEPAIGKVEFRNVSFAYPSRPEQTAMDDVSFIIEPGETVAIVGSSGAGKSTIFNLLQRFYDATNGIVLVDDVPVHRADLGELRHRLGVVHQETAIFADTVLENIRYGAPHAPNDKVIEAAKIAHAHDFIKDLPEAYDTKLGERGVTLSGGQRQRIAIARAVLRDAPILLLDEATSSLDSESEKLVQHALDRLRADHTVLIIAHRLATVQQADRILVMDDGKIVEMGTHKSLVETGGIYSRLAELQFSEHRAI